MKSAGVLIAALFLGPFSASSVFADTLFLRSGKTLKIEALTCDAGKCVATLEGGDAQLLAVDVLGVEPDETVDPEVAPAPGSALKSAVDARASRTIDQMVGEAAGKYGLPRSLVRAVARAESGMNPRAVSPKGAQGIMQLMPGTARELGVQNSLDPGENIDAGARLLRQLLEKYEGRVAEALAAYNAGPGAVARYKGVPPYLETHGYIRKIVKEFERAETEVARSSAPATK